MKVKISYTVDLEDVLSEVNILQQKANMLLKEVCDRNDLKASDSNIEEYLEWVDDARRKMYQYDLLMADIDGIVRSYADTKFSLKDKEKEVLNG